MLTSVLTVVLQCPSQLIIDACLLGAWYCIMENNFKTCSDTVQDHVKQTIDSLPDSMLVYSLRQSEEPSVRLLHCSKVHFGQI